MKQSIFYLVGLLACLNSFAQFETKDFGSFNGSFENNTQFYKKDTLTNAVLPQDKIGSNSFLKLDYTNKKISAGIQLESYLPSIAGYPGNMDGSKIINKFFTYRDNNLSVTIGDFYEQFGNGLIFRSFENRQIGINNALEGVNVNFSPTDFIQAKIVYGKQRKFFEKSDGVVRGGDVQFDLAKLLKKEESFEFGAALSYVSRFDLYTGSNPDIKPTVDAKAFRFNFGKNSFFLNTEIVDKSNDAHVANQYYTIKGKALLINTGYSFKNVGINTQFRRLENMDFRADRLATQSEYLVNYLPALTKQHHYNLSNIYVYNAQALGEIGGQIDIDINFPKNSFIGGKHGAKLAINASQYSNLDISNITPTGFESKYFAFGKEKYFTDISVEFKKNFSKDLTTTFVFQNLLYNKMVIEGGLYDDVKANIVTADVLYKYNTKNSVRAELQHLSTKQDKKNWAAAVVEFTFAPSITLFAQDLYNYGDVKKVHYYNTGLSYSFSGSRLMCSYGRQRAGLICTGGVCRLVPAFTGLNVSLTSNF